MERAKTSNPICSDRKTPNPSINTDASDKAAGAGYVKRYPGRRQVSPALRAFIDWLRPEPAG
jgi:hypothetical protein